MDIFQHRLLPTMLHISLPQHGDGKSFGTSTTMEDESLINSVNESSGVDCDLAAIFFFLFIFFRLFLSFSLPLLHLLLLPPQSAYHW